MNTTDKHFNDNIQKLVKVGLPFYLLTLLFLLSSCSDGDADAQQQQSASAAWLLRVTDGDVASLMPEGATAGIFVRNAEGTFTATNALLTCGKDGAGYCQAELPTAAAVTLYAYSPYRPDWSSAMAVAPQFEALSDQSRQAGYTASDLLMASAQTSDGHALLNFRHVMSRIVVHVTDRTGKYDMAHMVRVRLQHLETAVDVQLPDGIKGAVASSAADISPLMLDATSSRLTVAAIVAPQTLTAGDNFIQVLLSDQTLPYLAPEGTVSQMESGKTYIYRLLLTDGGLVPDGTTVTNWEDDGTETILQSE